MTHYCPNCSAFSYHRGPGVRHFALTCPHCGHTASQHPHPPRPARGEAAPIADVDVVAVAAIEVVAGHLVGDGLIGE